MTVIVQQIMIRGKTHKRRVQYDPPDTAGSALTPIYVLRSLLADDPPEQLLVTLEPLKPASTSEL